MKRKAWFKMLKYVCKLKKQGIFQKVEGIFIEAENARELNLVEEDKK